MAVMSDQAAAIAQGAGNFEGSNPEAIRVYGAAIQGRRSEQQDAFRSVWLAAEQAWLLVVADGMGGHAGGAVASRLAADAFVGTFTARRAAGVSLGEALQAALDDANARIARGQQEMPETEGMGTTLVAAHLSSEGLAHISVGDSPLWVLRAGALERINADHSFRPAVARGAKAIANMLQSVLNGDPIPLIDARPKPRRLRSGDLVIVASDGLLTLEASEIAAVAARHADAGAEAVTHGLLAEVVSRGKSNQDNCTVLVALAPIAAEHRTRWPAIVAATLAIVVTIGYLAWRLS